MNSAVLCRVFFFFFFFFFKTRRCENVVVVPVAQDSMRLESFELDAAPPGISSARVLRSRRRADGSVMLELGLAAERLSSALTVTVRRNYHRGGGMNARNHPSLISHRYRHMCGAEGFTATMTSTRVAGLSHVVCARRVSVG